MIGCEAESALQSSETSLDGQSTLVASEKGLAGCRALISSVKARLGQCYVLGEIVRSDEGADLSSLSSLFLTTTFDRNVVSGAFKLDKIEPFIMESCVTFMSPGETDLRTPLRRINVAVVVVVDSTSQYVFSSS